MVLHRNDARAAARSRGGSRWLAGVALVACLGAVSACGSSDDSDKSSATAASPSTQAAAAPAGAADATLKKLYAGVFQPPPTGGPKAVSGKHIYIVSCGQQFPTCATYVRSVQDAAKVLGWQSTVVDGKGQGSTFNAGVKQAVSARADAVVTVSFDCPAIKSSLLAAKAAKVPVFNYAGLDCDDASFGSGQALFAASLDTMGSTKITDYYSARGKGNADYIAARLEAAGKTDGKVLAMESIDQAGHKAGWQAFEQELKAKCPGCSLKRVTFTVAQVPNPAAQNWKTQIQANPDADAVAFDTNGWLAGGLTAALKISPNKDLIVCCGDSGDSDSLQVVRDGTITATNVWPLEYDGWAMADSVNRFLSGVPADKLPNQGGGFFYVDKDHGLPADGQGAKIPFDFKAARTKTWTGA
jgi:ribose transport system substrate-binding protein